MRNFIIALFVLISTIGYSQQNVNQLRACLDNATGTPIPGCFIISAGANGLYYEVYKDTSYCSGTTRINEYKISDSQHGVAAGTVVYSESVKGGCEITSHADDDVETVTGTGVTGTARNPIVNTPVTQVITDGVTTTSPSEDAVFDALALKFDDIIETKIESGDTVFYQRDFYGNNNS